MNSSKKSIILYVILVLTITYVWEIGIVACGAEYGSLRYHVLMLNIMWLPALAVVAAKLLCKEKVRIGLQSEILFFKEENPGIFGYVLIGIFAPILCRLAANGISYLLMPDRFDYSLVEWKGAGSDFLLILGMGIIFSLIEGLGEEIGWRGFLMPRLRNHMSMPGMLIVSGTIWGLWHAPMVYNGHNFGLDYVGAPWGGIFMMCVFCIFYGAWLYYLYEKSQSILVCALAHGFVNGTGDLGYIGMKEEVLEHLVTNFGFSCLQLLPLMLLGAWAFWQLCRMEHRSGKYIKNNEG